MALQVTLQSMEVEVVLNKSQAIIRVIHQDLNSFLTEPFESLVDQFKNEIINYYNIFGRDYYPNLHNWCVKRENN